MPAELSRRRGEPDNQSSRHVARHRLIERIEAEIRRLEQIFSLYVAGSEISIPIDGEEFLSVNGVQTPFSTYCSHIDGIEALICAGVKSLRLSPHSGDMVAAANLFRRVLDKEIEGREAAGALAALLPGAVLSNGFLRGGTCGAAFERS
jgi:collagenase-like PrtC family protease